MSAGDCHVTLLVNLYQSPKGFLACGYFIENARNVLRAIIRIAVTVLVTFYHDLVLRSNYMNFQALLMGAFQRTFHLTEAIAPPLAQWWAVRLFFRPMKFNRPPREARLITDAVVERQLLTSIYPRAAGEQYYVTYSWGTGPTVLLVHGWAGRGSQMATLAHPLVAAGYRVLTFDAPAHGDSPGQQTNLLEVSDIIRALSEREEGFAAIIGHSFGGMAAGFALAEGAMSTKLVTIGSPVTMENVLNGFGSQLNATAKTVDGVRQKIEQLAQRPVDRFSLSQTLAGSSVQGLIVHDRDDREVGFDQAELLHAVWPESLLHLTDGLGHRRILRDQATIARIVAFVNRGDISETLPQVDRVHGEQVAAH